MHACEFRSPWEANVLPKANDGLILPTAKPGARFLAAVPPPARLRISGTASCIPHSRLLTRTAGRTLHLPRSHREHLESLLRNVIYKTPYAAHLPCFAPECTDGNRAPCSSLPPLTLLSRRSAQHLGTSQRSADEVFLTTPSLEES